MMKKILVKTLLSALLIAGCSPSSPIQLNTPAPNSTAAPNSQVTVPGVTIRTYAPGPNPQANTSNDLGIVAGIVLGVWHGFIAPVTLAVSFFNPQVQMYEVHNDGNMYNLGFLFGFILFFVVLFLLTRIRRSR